ncbi:hypothetical protein [Nonomuraea sp. NPDC003214]
MRSRSDEILDEFGPVENIGENEPEAVTYQATVTRIGKHWTATVRDLPGGQTAHVQGASWKETKENVVDCVLKLRDDKPDAVAVQFVPGDPEVAAALATVSAARSARVQAELAERDAVYRAARLLVGKGWSTRDAGSALGLSHQRISQIAPRPAS